ncbi:MAG: AzlC family ABC transporter permease [Lachnospiraceae bacterium]|nr:AzlC family ABC transporter permease [Lachnospiraceae bacterium]
MLKKAVIKTLPVMAGYMVLGMGFGILLKVNGYGAWWAFLMSLFIYAGSMQYVSIPLITGGASFISIAITTLMVNARHLFYGISMIHKYKGAGIKKLYLMHALTDETYSLVCTDNNAEAERHGYYLIISLLNHCYWMIGSVLGALIGGLIKFDAKGIDFSMTALFVTVFVEQWMSTKEHRPALIGIGASVICLLLFGSEHFLIPAMIAITMILTAIRRLLEKGENLDGQ